MDQLKIKKCTGNKKINLQVLSHQVYFVMLFNISFFFK